MIIQISDAQQKKQIAGDILYQLPDWFGLPESTKRYIEESAEMPFWAWFEDVKEDNGKKSQALGFLALKETSPYAAELFVMGVLPKFHRQGIGKKLYFAAEDYAKEKGYTLLQVKTVQPGHYKEYDHTNAFYQAMGFLELECFPTLWDEWNPCQVYVKNINVLNKQKEICHLEERTYDIYQDVLLSDFSDLTFQNAFKIYFSELGITVKDWDSLFQEMNKEGDNAAFIRMTQDKKVIGFIQFKPIVFTSWFFEETYGFIREFWIAEKFRKNGHGSKLLYLAEKYFCEHGIYSSILTTDTAEDFYKKNGYEKVPGCKAKNQDEVFVKRLV